MKLSISFLPTFTFAIGTLALYTSGDRSYHTQLISRLRSICSSAVHSAINLRYLPAVYNLIDQSTYIPSSVPVVIKSGMSSRERKGFPGNVIMAGKP